MKRHLILIFAVLLTCAGSVLAAPPVAAPDQPISVDFPDEARQMIIRNITEVYALNVVSPVDVPGRVSIKIKDRDWRALFDEVLHPVGFAWREEGGVIRIYDALPEARVSLLTVDSSAKVSMITTICAVFLALFGVFSLILNIVLICRVGGMTKLLKQQAANQAPLPTPMSVTPPAGQEARQP